MAGERASSPSPMNQLIPFGKLKESLLKSLNGPRDKFLVSFDSTNLTDAEQQEVAHFLTWLDCLSVFYAAEIACIALQIPRDRDPDRSNMIGNDGQVSHESRKQSFMNQLYHFQFKIYQELVKN